ncbi:MAG: hypothetical protein OEZ43_21015 [Gammaproteobacteria bacterium]|nr:hypothetical protein [Gammaproteobacteria bacterium]
MSKLYVDGKEVRRPRISNYLDYWSGISVQTASERLAGNGFIYVEADTSDVLHTQIIADADCIYLQPVLTKQAITAIIGTANTAGLPFDGAELGGITSFMLAVNEARS